MRFPFAGTDGPEKKRNEGVSPFGFVPELSDDVEARSFLSHDQMLGNRVHLYAFARFLVVIGMMMGAVFATRVVGVRDLNVAGVIILSVLLTFYNCIVFILIWRHSRADLKEGPDTFWIKMVHATIMLDFLFLTGALWFVGGAKSPFQAFYLFNVILACVLLSRKAAYSHAAFAYCLLAGLIVGQWQGIIPAHYPEGAVMGGSGDQIDARFVLTVLTVHALLFALVCILLTGIMRLQHEGEQKLCEAYVKLGKLSKMRSEFLRIALHNLKSPVSAVTMLLRCMEFESQEGLTQQQKHLIERARIRLDGLKDFMRDLQNLSTLDSGEIQAHFEDVDIVEMIASITEENADLASANAHSLSFEPGEDVPLIRGIDRLLREAIVNLVTNAIKYTPQGGEITVRANSDGALVRIEVQDNGIGISQEDLMKLFDEFVRIERTDTPLGEVEGTGLGLSIVRRIIESHGGTVDVKSEVDVGSKFTITLPAAS